MFSFQLLLGSECRACLQEEDLIRLKLEASRLVCDALHRVRSASRPV